MSVCVYVCVIHPVDVDANFGGPTENVWGGCIEYVCVYVWRVHFVRVIVSLTGLNWFRMTVKQQTDKDRNI